MPKPLNLLQSIWASYQLLPLLRCLQFPFLHLSKLFPEISQLLLDTLVCFLHWQSGQIQIFFLCCQTFYLFFKSAHLILQNTNSLHSWFQKEKVMTQQILFYESEVIGPGHRFMRWTNSFLITFSPFPWNISGKQCLLKWGITKMFSSSRKRNGRWVSGIVNPECPVKMKPT